MNVSPMFVQASEIQTFSNVSNSDTDILNTSNSGSAFSKGAVALGKRKNFTLDEDNLILEVLIALWWSKPSFFLPSLMQLLTRIIFRG